LTRHISTVFDDHDYDQLKLLAKLNRVTLSELVRRLCKAHLDRNKPTLARERIDEG
jgi:hypothetical protein